MGQGGIILSALQIRPRLGGEGYAFAHLLFCFLSAFVFFVGS